MYDFIKVFLDAGSQYFIERHFFLFPREIFPLFYFFIFCTSFSFVFWYQGKPSFVGNVSSILPCLFYGIVSAELMVDCL